MEKAHSLNDYTCTCININTNDFSKQIWLKCYIPGWSHTPNFCSKINPLKLEAEVPRKTTGGLSQKGASSHWLLLKLYTAWFLKHVQCVLSIKIHPCIFIYIDLSTSIHRQPFLYTYLYHLHLFKSIHFYPLSNYIYLYLLIASYRFIYIHLWPSISIHLYSFI